MGSRSLRWRDGDYEGFDDSMVADSTKAEATRSSQSIEMTVQYGVLGEGDMTGIIDWQFAEEYNNTWSLDES